MRCELKAPEINKPLAAKLGLWNGLRVIGKTRSGRVIAANQFEAKPKTSNLLLPGVLFPADAADRAVAASEISEVIVKISPNKSTDPLLLDERDFLSELMGQSGFPRVLASGKIGVVIEDDIIDDIIGARNAPYFVMPLIKGEDLTASALQWRPENPPAKATVAFLAQQVFPLLAERLADVHEHNIVHRDVKPNNVLLDKRSLALTLLDFGRANWLNAELPRTDMGTFGFHSPEMLLEKGKAEDVRDDTYGFGTTCFTVLSGVDGVLYEGMINVWSLTGMDFMAWGKDHYMKNYYEAIAGLGNASVERLLALINMPPELKETALGKYLMQLFHPDRDQRPANLREVADNLRRFGGELDTTTIWST